jgi:hypothetical protein
MQFVLDVETLFPIHPKKANIPALLVAFPITRFALIVEWMKLSGNSQNKIKFQSKSGTSIPEKISNLEIRP